MHLMLYLWIVDMVACAISALLKFGKIQKNVTYVDKKSNKYYK